MHPIENIIESSMERIKRLVDVNTVVGDPIAAENDTVLLPVSKVSIGFVVGGGEYGGGKEQKKCAQCHEQESGAESRFPFAGGTTVGMSLKPMAFLAVEQGNVRIIPASPDCALDKLADFVPQALKSLDKIASAMVDKLGKKCENKARTQPHCVPTAVRTDDSATDGEA